MKRFISLVLAFVSICGLVCCNSKQKKVITAEDIRKFEERNIEVNREIVKLKQDTIKQYIEDHGLTMQKTGSGLWYRLLCSSDHSDKGWQESHDRLASELGYRGHKT